MNNIEISLFDLHLDGYDVIGRHAHKTEVVDIRLTPLTRILLQLIFVWVVA